MNIIKFAQRSDFVLGFVFLALSAYMLVAHSLLLSGVFLLSSIVSFVSAKYVPAKWLAKRMMLARLKA